MSAARGAKAKLRSDAARPSKTASRPRVASRRRPHWRLGRARRRRAAATRSRSPTKAASPAYPRRHFGVAPQRDIDRWPPLATSAEKRDECGARASSSASPRRRSATSRFRATSRAAWAASSHRARSMTNVSRALSVGCARASHGRGCSRRESRAVELERLRALTGDLEDDARPAGKPRITGGAGEEALTVDDLGAWQRRGGTRAWSRRAATARRTNRCRRAPPLRRRTFRAPPPRRRSRSARGEPRGGVVPAEAGAAREFGSCEVPFQTREAPRGTAGRDFRRGEGGSRRSGGRRRPQRRRGRAAGRRRQKAHPHRMLIREPPRDRTSPRLTQGARARDGARAGGRRAGGRRAMTTSRHAGGGAPPIARLSRFLLRNRRTRIRSGD